MDKYTSSKTGKLDDYYAVGWYGVKEAEGLLKQLKSSNIRFLIDISKKGEAVIPKVVIPSPWPAFGQNSQLLLYIHIDDSEQFAKLQELRWGQQLS